MGNNSLNRLAWDRFKKNKLSLSALIFIIGCFFVAIFAVFFSPDKSRMANDMNLETAMKSPLETVYFLEIPIDYYTKKSTFKDFFLGKLEPVDRIPLSSYNIIDGGIDYFIYGTNQKQQYIGNYEIYKRVFWLGSDKYGRDLLSRIIHGLRVSLSVGSISVIISLIIGVILGLLAGYFRGITDDVIMWLVNVIWSIPTLLMVIAITLALGKGFWQLFIAIGLTMWVEVARVVRGQVLVIRELEYIEAGKVLAYKSWRIILKHIMPNVIAPVIVISVANFSSAILIESGLSFLGIGVQPPLASLGGIIKDHYTYIIMDKAYLAIFPGLVIVFIVLSFMIFGNGLRDAFDVKH
tara:strand:- start:448 stop:1500 length:1053 start_codon:yes stop_codon:yes gene_type:complete